jgi:hypothetical protein
MELYHYTSLPRALLIQRDALIRISNYPILRRLFGLAQIRYASELRQ